MNNDILRRIFLLVNFIVIVVLAVLVIIQIWFDLWDNWDIVIKAAGTYVVMLIAAYFFSQSEHIANLIFKSNDKNKDKS